MTCVNGRAALSTNDERQLFADAGGFCQRCALSLFLEIGERRITIAEMAHVVAASAAGPRGASDLGTVERSDPENVVLLCPTCHTIVDKAPEEFPVKLLLQWKEERRRMLALLLGVPKARDRTEARKLIAGPLRTNKLVWSEYGPEAPSSGHPDDESGSAWRRKVLETILPNNRRILAVFDLNGDLLTEDEIELVELFRQHLDDIEVRHLRGLAEPGARRFPSAVELIFRDIER
jgi:hypothetical protein